MKKNSGAVNAARFFSILAIGASLTMAQQPAGTIRAWGFNADSQLGDGLTGNAFSPESVEGLTNVVSVATGRAFSLAVKSDGSVFAWGLNNTGNLGIGSDAIVVKPLPVPVTGFGTGSGVIAVAAGGNHALALKSDGSVWSWGRNGNGELGLGGAQGIPATVNVPTQVVGLGPGSGVIAIAAGGVHSMALKSDGTVLTWGLNVVGELGAGPINNQTAPVQVTGFGQGSGAIAIAAGASHNLVLRSDGSVAAWGSNDTGQVGTGTNIGPGRNFDTPVAVSGLASGAGVIGIAAGGNHSLALKSDGSVLAWGFNKTGQLGNADPSNADQGVPVAVSGFGIGSGVIAIAAGVDHSLALKSDGTEWAWGFNQDGELGDGTNVDENAPVQVSKLNGAVTIALGPAASHSLAIVQPVALLSTASLSFGDQLIGTLSASQTIAIQNNGQDPLVINGLSVSSAANDFKISAPPTPFTIAPGASNVVSVAFSPIAAFGRLANLLIDGNAFSAPQLVSLSGNGTAQSDIAVSLASGVTRVKNRGNLTYTITVNNGGPTAAPAVVVTDVLPSGTTFVSSKTTQGACQTPAPGASGTLTCNLGTVNNGATATVTLVVAVNAAGSSTVVNTASAIAGASDPNLGNNSATVITPVFGPKH
jgi:uncharacterized repeat protein (TIGR01451 family)